ncbi:MAG TPA: DUF4185 domain-containing protein, partial [Bryobacteraceae bacterium]|nr:DUF4185 domain-containing protein [Bryobacteraceae bacterium]
TWGDDDELYAAYSEGEGFAAGRRNLSLGFAKITGDPPRHHAEDIPSDADTPAGEQQIRPTGMLMTGSTLYLFVRNYAAGGDRRHVRLGWSHDHARHWTWADWHFSRTFGCPEFVQYGRNNAGARDRYVYIISQDNDDARDYDTHAVLARVPRERLSDRGAYEFFRGLDPNGDPLWSRDIEQRRPVFSDPLGVQHVAVSYNPRLRRYLLTSKHRVSSSEGGSGSQNASLGVFDAPEPWGPWTTVYYDDHWFRNHYTYHHTIPTKWIDEDGKSMWMVFSGPGGGNNTFCLRRATLEPVR